MSTLNLHLGDCMEAMEGMKENQYDLAIVDPPYGIGAGIMTMGKGSRNDKGKNKKKQWDNSIPDESYFLLLNYKSVNQIIWGGNYFNLPPSRCYLLWDKMDYNSDFASHEMAWTSFDKVVKCFRKARSADGEGKGKIHPTQKPIKLYKWLLTNYAKEGDTILDTHGGSMSIAIACGELGFDLDLWELDEEYFNNGVERVKRHFKQLDMFQEKPTINVIR